MLQILCHGRGKTKCAVIRANSVSFIARRLKGRSSRLLGEKFPELKKWCKDSLWAPSCYHGSVGHGWEVVEKYIAGQDRKS
ncbi:MAG: transposase [Candidatus Methanoperedenaceae archaeon]|nr:transposase [Candidatus Methanoperedenaceae archaeon]